MDKDVELLLKQLSGKKPLPIFTTKEGDGGKVISINLNGNDQEDFLKNFGTTNTAFGLKVMGDISSIMDIGCTSPQKREESLNAGMAIMAGIAPKDEAEGMLAAQMAATSHMAMRMLHKTAMTSHLDAQQWFGNFAIKLLRTYTTQMETLQRYRGKGEQKVTVEHVHVHAGGQAVVGVVTPRGGGVQEKTAEQPHAQE
ncbi:MAG: hypothetical protein ACK5O9_07745 [Holosporales bacterium]|jgi:hypothetical protein